MNILNIYICVKKSTELNELRDLVINIIKENRLDINLKMVTSNPSKLIKGIDSYTKLSIYIIGMELVDKIYGIQLAEKVRKIDPRGFIVFMIDNSEKAVQIFKYHIEVLDCICKDDVDKMQTRIKESLLNAEMKYKLAKLNDSNRIIIKNRNTIKYVLISEIVFVEAINKKKIRVVTQEEEIERYGTLNQILITLDERFFKWNQYIINKDYVTHAETKSEAIYLCNNTYCLISNDS